MKDRIKKIDKVLKEIELVIKLLCISESKEAFDRLAKVMPDMNEMIGKLLSEIPYYRELGVDLPEDIILAQLQNLMEGMKHKDMVLLADSLNYEIGDTLQVYKEILEQL